MKSGNKYHRIIEGIDRDDRVTVDVYAVLVAFDVRCPARQHAIKKLLCTGIRGKGDSLQDLHEARDAIDRAIALEHRQQAIRCDVREVNIPPTPHGKTSIAKPNVTEAMVSQLRQGLAGGAHIETKCRVCHNKMNYLAGQLGDCICTYCGCHDDGSIGFKINTNGKRLMQSLCVDCGAAVQYDHNEVESPPTHCEACSSKRHAVAMTPKP